MGQGPSNYLAVVVDEPLGLPVPKNWKLFGRLQFLQEEKEGGDERLPAVVVPHEGYRFQELDERERKQKRSVLGRERAGLSASDRSGSSRCQTSVRPVSHAGFAEPMMSQKSLSSPMHSPNVIRATCQIFGQSCRICGEVSCQICGVSFRFGRCTALTEIHVTTQKVVPIARRQVVGSCLRLVRLPSSGVLNQELFSQPGSRGGSPSRTPPVSARGLRSDSGRVVPATARDLGGGRHDSYGGSSGTSARPPLGSSPRLPATAPALADSTSPRAFMIHAGDEPEHERLLQIQREREFLAKQEALRRSLPRQSIRSWPSSPLILADYFSLQQKHGENAAIRFTLFLARDETCCFLERKRVIVGEVFVPLKQVLELGSHRDLKLWLGLGVEMEAVKNRVSMIERGLTGMAEVAEEEESRAATPGTTSQELDYWGAVAGEVDVFGGAKSPRSSSGLSPVRGGAAGGTPGGMKRAGVVVPPLPHRLAPLPWKNYRTSSVEDATYSVLQKMGSRDQRVWRRENSQEEVGGGSAVAFAPRVPPGSRDLDEPGGARPPTSASPEALLPSSSSSVEQQPPQRVGGTLIGSATNLPSTDQANGSKNGNGGGGGYSSDEHLHDPATHLHRGTSDPGLEDTDDLLRSLRLQVAHVRDANFPSGYRETLRVVNHPEDDLLSLSAAELLLVEYFFQQGLVDAANAKFASPKLCFTLVHLDADQVHGGGGAEGAAASTAGGGRTGTFGDQGGTTLELVGANAEAMA